MAKKTILVVDDEEPILDAIEEILKPEGYTILKASNGKECLSKLSKKPDLVLLDFFMPDMSGREVLEEIRKNPKTKNTKVALLTAASFSPAGEKKLEGMDIEDDIKKPFHQKDLIKRVKGMIG